MSDPTAAPGPHVGPNEDPSSGAYGDPIARLAARIAALESAPGGSAPSGTPIVRAFPFTFDTPNLLTGHSVWTPAVGDVLLDAWIEVDTPWDVAVSINADAGQFVGVNFGLWGGSANGPIDLKNPDQDGTSYGAGTLAAPFNGASSMMLQGIPYSTPHFPPYRAVPLKFTTDDPIKVVVSQDGTNTGADPGSTQGAAILYLVTCTPAT